MLYTLYTIATSAVGGTVVWIYSRYKTLTKALNDRPTKAEVESITKHEADKIEIRLDSLESSIKELHGDVQLLLNCLLYAQRQTPESGAPASPKKLH